MHTDKIPYLKTHLNDTCPKCNHKTDAGEPVPPHRLGDLICPEVQAGRVGCHPRWIKIKDQYPNVKWYNPADKGKGDRTFRTSKGKDQFDDKHKNDEKHKMVKRPMNISSTTEIMTAWKSKTRRNH